jgi:hypothetical protein
MKKLFFYTITIITLLTATNCKGSRNGQMTMTIESDTSKIKEIFGYRFVITGDFDGDGKMEQLFEHYFSLRDNKETNKFYDGLNDYSDAVELAINKDAYVFLSSDNPLIDTLRIIKGGQVFGISYLKNEGDLDGDGGDEVSYVIDWADWSNCNIWYIMTYKKGEWKELYSFDIWDWQLPPLPYISNQYGLCGTEGKFVIPENDTLNRQIEKALLEFAGLVKKIKTNKIQVIFSNEEAMEDTMIVNLKQLNKINKSTLIDER